MNWQTVIINLALVILLAPLFEGVIRKLKARIHSRQGPPVIQPYLDLMKLLVKEELRPQGAGMLFWLAPRLALGATLVVALMVPIGGLTPLGPSSDLIALLYLVSLAAVAVMMGAFASGNPYALVGASREMMTVLVVEPVLAIALIVVALKSGSFMLDGMVNWQAGHGLSLSTSLAGVAFFLALQAQLGKLPFDIAEAETEIMEGPFIEQSGPGLALFKWSFFAKQLIFSALLVQIFLPWPRFGLLPADLALTLAKVFVLVVVVGLIESVTPRLRIDQSLGYLSRVIFIALAGVAFAVIGV